MEEEKDSEKKEKEEQKLEEKEKESGENKMSLTVFLLLLITAIIKDLIEIILGVIALLIPALIPIIIVLCFILCLPFSAFMFAIILLSGVRATWLLAGTIIDQLLSGLPGGTITVILAYVFDKAPAPIKKTVEKASKLTSLKSSTTKI
ncbi:MAG: hypothetical protein WC306_02915 [Candidatus Paceibacterota bacterium]|jgi:uncharacterized membrane protein